MRELERDDKTQKKIRHNTQTENKEKDIQNDKDGIKTKEYEN